ncbi:MAG: vWA domain-containing protein [Bacteroidota bacterium]
MKIKHLKYYTALVFILLIITISGFGQDSKSQMPKSRILFIFDGSQSMEGYWEEERKIKIARDYLIQMIDSLDGIGNVEMGLRVYGHQYEVPPQRCDDTKLEVPFSKNNGDQLKHTLRYIRPKGTTPIAHSLKKAENDFSDCEECRNVIVLITDGKEACEGDPCEVSKELQKKGIALKPFIIGIGLDPNFKKTFECIGHFYNTPNKEKFRQALDVVITKILNNTTAQVNLLDTYGKPTESNVGMTFHHRASGKIKYNFIHTLNFMGNPDTLTMDPLPVYDLIVHTLPKIKKDSIKLTVGKHNMIGVNAAQGSLKFTSDINSSRYRNLQCIVRKDGSHKTLNVQKIDKKEKYLTGKYDLEILTLPTIEIEDVEIEQSHTTKIEIPKPGMLNILLSTSGYGYLFEKKKSGKLSRIYNLNSIEEKKSLILQPGNYEITFRPKNMKKTMYTTRKTFEIKSGSSKTIKLY